MVVLLLLQTPLPLQQPSLLLLLMLLQRIFVLLLVKCGCCCCSRLPCFQCQQTDRKACPHLNHRESSHSYKTCAKLNEKNEGFFSCILEKSIAAYMYRLPRLSSSSHRRFSSSSLFPPSYIYPSIQPGRKVEFLYCKL